MQKWTLAKPLTYEWTNIRITKEWHDMMYRWTCLTSQNTQTVIQMLWKPMAAFISEKLTLISMHM